MNNFSGVCVVGDSGLLGQAFLKALSGERAPRVWGISTSPFAWPGACPGFVYTHDALDLSKEPKIFVEKLKKFRPQLLINCAAMTDLLQCEKNPNTAKKMNALLPEWLAKICAQTGVRMIQVSTDQIFDGKKKTPYTEEDAPSPIHVYGKTKLLGEEKALKANPDALVARTNIVGFRGRAMQPTYIEWLCAALGNQEPITLADDFVTSSIQATAFARLLLLGYRRGLKGIFNIASKDPASKYRFGRLLAEELRLSFSGVTKGSLKDLRLFPKRPAYSALDVSKNQAATGVSLPTILESIKALAKDLRLVRRETVYA